MLWMRANSRRWLVGGLLLLGALPVLAPTQRARAADDTPPQDVIKALEDVYGVHRGQRRNHAKGTCAIGEFVGRPAAAAYSRSALFSGRAVPVVARFSLAGMTQHYLELYEGLLAGRKAAGSEEKVSPDKRAIA